MTEENHRVAIIAGDLNGKTVTHAALSLHDALRPALNRGIDFTDVPYDSDYFNQKDITELGDEELTFLRGFDQIFLGAVGDPTKIKPGVMEVGLLLKIRQAFDQYVNLRPVILPEGVPSIIVGKDHHDINFEICRENSEGLYVHEGKVVNRDTDDEYAEQVMRCSYRGIKRLTDFALGRARARSPKPRLHFVFKTNILTDAAVPWKRVEDETREANPDVDVRYMHIDNFMMQMITNPRQFDVVVTENMFGDISTDLGAVIQGGIGTAVSGNINPTGEYPSMFEPIHGSAPDKWYETDKKTGEYVEASWRKRVELVQRIRPEAAFMSYAMMLDQMQEKTAAQIMRNAALNNIRDPNYKKKSCDDLVEQAQDYIEKEARAA